MARFSGRAEPKVNPCIAFRRSDSRLAPCASAHIYMSVTASPYRHALAGGRWEGVASQTTTFARPPRDRITFASASAASSSASASVGCHRDPAPHLAVDLYRVLDGASTR